LDVGAGLLGAGAGREGCRSRGIVTHWCVCARGHGKEHGRLLTAWVLPPLPSPAWTTRRGPGGRELGRGIPRGGAGGAGHVGDAEPRSVRLQVCGVRWAAPATRPTERWGAFRLQGRRGTRLGKHALSLLLQGIGQSSLATWHPKPTPCALPPPRVLPGKKLDIRLDRLDDKYGSPSIEDIEKFSRWVRGWHGAPPSSSCLTLLLLPHLTLLLLFPAHNATFLPLWPLQLSSHPHQPHAGSMLCHCGRVSAPCSHHPNFHSNSPPPPHSMLYLKLVASMGEDPASEISLEVRASPCASVSARTC